jgi:aminoglycoside 3-N-acetyltransferase
MAYTKQDLIKDIGALGIDGRGTLFIHSSIKSVGAVEGADGGGETILDAFIEYMSGGLLIFPTHTWEQIKPGGLFDPATEKPCVGMLPYLFMKRPGVVRSIHPTHSMAALGADAEDFTRGEVNSITPCSRGGCYGKLLDRRAQILFLGCSLKCNTFLHGVEEWSDIPSRLSDKTVEYKLKMPDGSVVTQRAYRHSGGKYGNVSDSYDKMEAPFLHLGIAREGKIGDARCVLCDARGMYELTTWYLQ